MRKGDEDWVKKCMEYRVEGRRLHSHTHHIVAPGFVDRLCWSGVTALLARWTKKLAGGPQAGTSDSPH